MGKIPITIDTKTINFLDINLTKDVLVLYGENDKRPLKDMYDNLKNYVHKWEVLLLKSFSDPPSAVEPPPRCRFFVRTLTGNTLTLT